jgi:hypothetical protein
MRSKKSFPKHGDTKIVEKFLLLPFSIRTEDYTGRWHKETRWLERVKIQYRYEDHSIWGYGGLMGDCGWVARRFVD